MRLLLLVPLVILAAPLPKPQFDATVEYLYRFGYLSTNSPSLHELRAGLKVFQDVAGLPITGEVDEATLAAQRRPRCAHPDTKKVGSRKKRFALASQSKWDKSHFTGENQLHLKWHVSKYTKDLKEKVIRSTIHKAFALWSNQANLKDLPKVTFHFEEVPSNEPADIDIKWAEGDHGDSYTFDGSRTTHENILAHTFFPGHSKPLNGDIHFDDAEDWETDPEKMKDSYSDRRFFPYVLAHEIGHALGLQHSRKPDAVMNPYYSNTPLDQLKLDVDDKCGINWNYAGPSKFCLFVWLMSEIIPAQNNNSEFHHQISSSDHVLPGEKRVYSARRLLKNVRIPRCTSSNGLQVFAEKKLHRNLQFPSDEAKKYSEVVCNFLAGLHVYRGGPDYSQDDSLDKEYLGVYKEVSVFGTTSLELIRRLARQADDSAPSVFDPSYFDAAFFDNFLPQYVQHVLLD